MSFWLGYVEGAASVLIVLGIAVWYSVRAP
jgi:hypothetical protein